MFFVISVAVLYFTICLAPVAVQAIGRAARDHRSGRHAKGYNS